CDSAMSARSSASSSSCCSLRSFLILQLFDANLQFLELLLAALHGDLLSLIQTVLQVFDGLLHVLLHALQMGTGVALHLLLDSHVPLGLVHFLVLLDQLALHVSLHLVKLQLCSEDLALFVLQGTFSFLQRRL
uniref:Dynein light chain n=1 Tax=Astatotilapia calliptera TaxID=8154 RepID=A0AAX7TRC0_ASTCA